MTWQKITPKGELARNLFCTQQNQGLLGHNREHRGFLAQNTATLAGFTAHQMAGKGLLVENLALGGNFDSFR